MITFPPPHIMGRVARAIRKRRRAQRRYNHLVRVVPLPSGGGLLASKNWRRAKKWDRAAARWERDMQCGNAYWTISQ